MATLNQTTGAPAHTFKGHSQPPPNERLQECKNYLADEDVNRNLHFKSRLRQVEEYIKDLEENKVPCDPRLLRDVQIMAIVHREWMDHFMDAPPSNDDSCKQDRPPPVSQRFVSKEVRKELQDQKEAMGLRNQTREDHAPFTYYGTDEIDFRLKLKHDESENPDIVDEATNLLWVENRSYNWALNEPSLIPVWLHPRLGLPDKGIKVSDAPPWYRKDGVLRHGWDGGRPPPQKLPDFLQRSQDAVNIMLKDYASDFLDDEKTARLSDYLTRFELESLKTLREKLEHKLHKHPDMVGDNEDLIATDLRHAIMKNHTSWLSSFARKGIQLMVGVPSATDILYPGLFYVPADLPSMDDEARIGRVGERANQLLHKGADYLSRSPVECMELLEYMYPIWPKEMKRLADEIVKIRMDEETETQFTIRVLERKKELLEAGAAFLQPFFDTGIQMRFNRPGEFLELTPGLVLISWEPHPHQSESLKSTEDLQKLQTSINNNLEGLVSYPNDVPANMEKRKDLTKDLEKVMYPKLRKTRRKYLDLEKRRSISAETEAEYLDIEWEYQTTFTKWADSFMPAGVKVRMAQPFHLDERPGILYLRDPSTPKLDVQEVTAIMDSLAISINKELREMTQMSNDPEDQPLYSLLVNLQYPNLKRMDEEWRAKSIHNNPTADQIKAEQRLRKRWRTAYNAWVTAFQDEVVEITLPSSPTDPAGDPSIVYYRGPLHQEEPDVEPDPEYTQQKVDHAMLVLTWNSSLADDKWKLAAQLEKVSCLPPSLMRKLHDYYATKTPEHRIAREAAFISAFTGWESMVRGLAKAVPESAIRLPKAQLMDEIEINKLLQNQTPTRVEDIHRLNELLSKYWHRQLEDLRWRRRARMRASGKSETEIDSESMEIDQFATEFEQFKTDCRARGFKIYYDVATGGFEALYPDPGPLVSVRRQMSAILTTSEREASQNLDLGDLNENEVRDLIFDREQEINQLLNPPNVECSTPMTNSPASSVFTSSSNASGSIVSTKGSRYPPRPRTASEDSRLIGLLRMFFPPRLKSAYNDVQSFTIQISAASGPRKGEIQLRQAEAVKTFLNLYEPWLRRLTYLGARLVLSPPTDAGQNSLGDDQDGILYVPDTRIPPSTALDEMSQLVTGSDLPSQFRQIETDINRYLRIKQTKGLSLKSDKGLRRLLTTVMPRSLAELDSALRISSQNARDRLLQGSELLDYIALSDRWTYTYYAWLNEFVEKGVKLVMKGPNPIPLPRTSKIKYIQIDSVDELPDDTTSTLALPLHIQEKEKILNQFLRNDSTLSKPQEIWARNLVASYWKPTGDDMRRKWLAQIATACGIDSQQPSTRLLAAVNAQIRNSFMAFLRRALNSDLKLQLEFVELRPESFTLRVARATLDDSNSTEAEQNIWELITQDALRVTGPDGQGKLPLALSLALDEFLPLAHKLRSFNDTGMPLTDAELKKARDLLQPLSHDEIDTLENDIADLLDKLARQNSLSRTEQDQLKDLTIRQMWYLWGWSNYRLRENVLETVNKPAPIETLLFPMLPGAVQPEPPSLDPPTETESLELEIMVSDLLTKWKAKSLTDQELSKLIWHLRPLAPPDIRSLDRQVLGLHWKAANLSVGLDVNESLKLAELSNAFDTAFLTWMIQLSNFGSLLATWWFNREAMQGLFVHARMWNDAVAAQGSDIPIDDNTSLQPKQDSMNTSNAEGTPVPVIDDEMLRQQHDNVELLRQFAENYEGIHHERLLLDHMPGPVKSLYEEIQSLRDRQRYGHMSLDEHARLRIVTGDFVRDHMAWYSGLTSEQLFTLRGNTVDFTGKAERRGVKRAAVELALNLLATNQEQHRPHDRFRKLPLPPKYQPPLGEVPLWKPLEPWKRPVELDPFHYSKLMQKFRRWKDDDYEKARNHVINENPGRIHPPPNYNGPFTLENQHGMMEIASKRQNHLLQISSKLLEALKAAPRPLLQRLCILMGTKHDPLPTNMSDWMDDVPLTKHDLDIFLELCEDSWNNEQIEYGLTGTIAGFPDADPEFQLEFARLKEFERDVEQARVESQPEHHLVPLWEPPVLEARQIPDVHSVEYFTQRPYSASLRSTTGVSLNDLRTNINNAREASANPNFPHMWTEEEVKKYLQVMHNYGRIHYDVAHGQVARIPANGHPEHKYVLSEEDAQNAPYISYNDITKKYSVQYNAKGVHGIPIVQPNKYKYLEKIAFRLSRDVDRLTIRYPVDDAARYREQSDALARTLQYMEEIDPRHAADITSGRELSLKNIARKLVQYAPELRQDIGMDLACDINTITNDEAAKIIQLQLIEESNNNWEPRFPKEEHVWDWVKYPQLPMQPRDGVALTATMDNDHAHHHGNAAGHVNAPIVYRSPITKQYFSMEKWPVQCQSKKVQDIVENSQPVWPNTDTDTDTFDGLQTQTQTQTTLAQTAQQALFSPAAKRNMGAVGPYPREQFTGKGGAPNFPFGENPYQAAFKSWEIETHLADTPPFANVPETGVLNKLKRKLAPPVPPYGDRFALPQIPPEWDPTSVSITEKRHDIIDQAKQTAGFPKNDEDYYRPVEVAQIKAYKVREHAFLERQRARAKIIERAGKPYNQIGPVELQQLQTQLNIDPVSEEIQNPE